MCTPGSACERPASSASDRAPQPLRSGTTGWRVLIPVRTWNGDGHTAADTERAAAVHACMRPWACLQCGCWCGGYLVRAGLEARHGFGVLLARERRYLRSEDARLFPRNQRERVTQHLHMVIVQGCHGGGDGSGDDVGGVDAAPDADLQHHHVHTRLHKHVERQKRQEPAATTMHQPMRTAAVGSGTDAHPTRVPSGGLCAHRGRKGLPTARESHIVLVVEVATYAQARVREGVKQRGCMPASRGYHARWLHCGRCHRGGGEAGASTRGGAHTCNGGWQLIRGGSHSVSGRVPWRWEA